MTPFAFTAVDEDQYMIFLHFAPNPLTPELKLTDKAVLIAAELLPTPMYFDCYEDAKEEADLLLTRLRVKLFE